MRSEQTRRVLQAAVAGGMQLAEVEHWLNEVRLAAHHRGQSQLIRLIARAEDYSKTPVGVLDAIWNGTHFDDAELEDFVEGNQDVDY